MKKITLAVPRGQYDPITENRVETLNLLSTRVNCLKNVVECTIHEYFTSDIDYKPACYVFRKWCYDIYYR